MRWTVGPVEGAQKWLIWLAGPRSPWSLNLIALRLSRAHAHRAKSLVGFLPTLARSCCSEALLVPSRAAGSRVCLLFVAVRVVTITNTHYF